MRLIERFVEGSERAAGWAFGAALLLIIGPLLFIFLCVAKLVGAELE